MKSILPLITFLFTLHTFAQTPSIEWQRRFGGSDEDNITEIKKTPDGGYIVLGRTFSNDGDVTGNHGGIDFWLLKLSANGSVEWQKTYGGTEYDLATAIELTNDSGYIIAGSTESNDGDVSGNLGNNDGWVIKVNTIGVIEWQRTYGGTSGDVFNSICKTSDNGYILAGSSYSNDGDTVSNNGVMDAWVIKINAAGIIQWRKSYGGAENDTFLEVKPTPDGGYILVGVTSSSDGVFAEQHGTYDAWIHKTDAVGTTQWQKVLGGSNYDSLESVTLTSDNNILACGYTVSNDGNLTNNHGQSDCWVMKLTQNGTILWSKLYGGSESDGSGTVIETMDGNYVIASNSNSNNGDVTQTNGDVDGWLFKTDPSGTILWQKAYGSSHQEVFYDILTTSDNGFIVAGSIFPIDDDTATNGGTDFLITKLTPDNLSTNDVIVGKNAKIYPVPMRDKLFIEMQTNRFSGMISDLNGKMLLKFKSNEISHTISTADLPKGVYILELNTVSGKEVYKIVK